MKRIINTLLLLSVAIIAMAQTSFVVADKNGNSQLVQSLVFQQQQTADRFSWKSDGSANGDINDLLFIARAKAELATASSDDVTEMLEQLSGTDLADAEGIAATVKENPNVEDAYTADGDNLVYHKEGSDYLTIYPMYDLKPAFSESDYEGAKQLLGKQYVKTKKASSSIVSKVAIFNFFEGDSDYDLQNKLVGAIYSLFDKNGYDVKMYQNEEFTVKKLEEVVSESKKNKNYKAIIIMSHGSKLYESTFTKEATSVFMTGEVCGQYASCDKMFDSKSNKYYKIHTSALTPDKDCILYLGSCYSAYWGEDLYKEEKVEIPYDFPYSNKVKEDEYPEKDKLTVIAWFGRNSIAQAHAAILFRRMIYDEQTLFEAAANSFFRDPVNMTAGVFYSKSIFAGNEITLSHKYGNQPDYTNNASVRLTSMSKDILIKKEGNSDFYLDGVIEGNNNIKGIFYVSLYQVLDGENRKEFSYDDARPIFINKDKTFSGSIPLKYYKEGLYAIKAYTVTDYKEIKIQNPYYIVYSRNLNENYALPEVSEEDFYTPVILGSEGQPLEEITIPAGTSQTYQIDAYPGHTFETPCLDKSVCDVSVSGNTLTVKGLKEGSTIFGVFDVQNRQMSVVQATVTAGGGGDVVAYTSCPDSHHPHLIDLGLPSGTKWACCNVGAQKPEDYGGYFAWGETTEKNRYYWDTYIHYDGSSSTCHDIGKDIAGTQYDAATVNWGSPWVMPSKEQMKELQNNCTSEWTTENGVNGRRFTASNGASIFLPAAGDRYDDDYLDNAGSGGYYWSSTLCESYTYDAWDFRFVSGYVYTHLRNYRFYGRSVRPVRKN